MFGFVVFSFLSFIKFTRSCHTTSWWNKKILLLKISSEKQSADDSQKTNHQFHIKPKTVPNTRPISIQTFLIPFGAFGALKGLIVPSSALLQSLHLCDLLWENITDSLVLSSWVPLSGARILQKHARPRNTHLCGVCFTLLWCVKNPKTRWLGVCFFF